MAYLAVDEDGTEWIYDDEPFRQQYTWVESFGCGIKLPSGSIAKLIGKELTWEDEPYELE